MEVRNLMSSKTFDGNVVPSNQCGLETTNSHAMVSVEKQMESATYYLHIGAYSHTRILT